MYVSAQLKSLKIEGFLTMNKSKISTNVFTTEYTQAEEQLIADITTSAIEAIRLHKKQAIKELSGLQIEKLDNECHQLQNLLYKCALRKQLQV